jgi:hypothetical protein
MRRFLSQVLHQLADCQATDHHQDSYRPDMTE